MFSATKSRMEPGRAEKDEWGRECMGEKDT